MLGGHPARCRGKQRQQFFDHVGELRLGNIVARDLTVVVSPAFGEVNVIGVGSLDSAEAIAGFAGDVDDVVQTLRDRPGHQHVIITGRRADPRLVEAANLVTEMTEVKHPFNEGQKGQRGIEW